MLSISEPLRALRHFRVRGRFNRRAMQRLVIRPLHTHRALCSSLRVQIPECYSHQSDPLYVILANHNLIALFVQNPRSDLKIQTYTALLLSQLMLR